MIKLGQILDRNGVVRFACRGTEKECEAWLKSKKEHWAKNYPELVLKIVYADTPKPPPSVEERLAKIEKALGIESLVAEKKSVVSRLKFWA